MTAALSKGSERESSYFEELDYRPTPIGALSLRRRRELSLEVDVFEIKLGDKYLMSSLFTASEIALARLGLAELSAADLDVVVAGLGLGYTAQAVLEHKAVKSLVIVEALDAVIDWHEKGVLPLGPALTADPRSRFVLGDFFALAASKDGFDPDAPARRFDDILVDIDHSPDFLLDRQNADFYQPSGLKRLAAHLHAGGVFGLWSNELPDASFTAAGSPRSSRRRAPSVWHSTTRFRTGISRRLFTSRELRPCQRRMRLNDGNHSMAYSQIPYTAEQEFQIAILFQSAFGSGTSKISAADEVFEKEGKGRQRQAACRNITRPQANDR